MLNEFLFLMRSELLITLLIFLLLFIKLGKGISNLTVLKLVYFFLIINTVIPFFGVQEGRLFADMFISTPMIFFQKALLSGGTLLIALLNYDWLKKHVHLSEFFVLILSALLGMYLMISSGNLLIFYLSLELATIPVAALANFDLDNNRSSEAATKMILSSAFSSGVLLFGISLLYGAAGTIQFAELPGQLQNGDALVLTGFILFFTGVAFKLSVVPFHLWTADVYEGSPVAVTSFLSVVSKGSIAFIFITILYKVFQPLGTVTYQLLVILSVATLMIGNLFALRQNNLKRFLAFSSIAQVGFILVGISGGTLSSAVSVVYFVLIYIFSNLAAFGVISLVTEATGRETIDSYKGLYKNNKLLSWVMAIALFSLAGIPPTAGFFGKLFLIMSGAATAEIWFIVLVSMNLVVSLFYYLKVVRAIFTDNTDNQMEKVKLNSVPKWTLLFCTVAIIGIGFAGWIYEYILSLQ
ncbi:MAG: NADH-quinone oxidoreductase subunit N [Chitinophagaceae bacterium]